MEAAPPNDGFSVFCTSSRAARARSPARSCKSPRENNTVAHKNKHGRTTPRREDAPRARAPGVRGARRRDEQAHARAARARGPRVGRRVRQERRVRRARWHHHDLRDRVHRRRRGQAAGLRAAVRRRESRRGRALDGRRRLPEHQVGDRLLARRALARALGAREPRARRDRGDDRDLRAEGVQQRGRAPNHRDDGEERGVLSRPRARVARPLQQQRNTNVTAYASAYRRS